MESEPQVPEAEPSQPKEAEPSENVPIAGPSKESDQQLPDPGLIVLETTVNHKRANYYVCDLLPLARCLGFEGEFSLSRLVELYNTVNDTVVFVGDTNVMLDISPFTEMDPEFFAQEVPPNLIEKQITACCSPYSKANFERTLNGLDMAKPSDSSLVSLSTDEKSIVQELIKLID